MVFRVGIFWMVYGAGWLSAEGGIRVDPLFSDHMVLQRDVPVRVFGSGEEGVEVAVRLADSTASARVKDGAWMVELPAMRAGGPHVLEVSGPRREVFADVMVGDVWVASGQSNMHMRLKFLPEYKRDASGFGNPMVRMFKAAVAPAETPMREVVRDADFSGGWRVADSAGSGMVSAVGYYYCDILQKALGIPIGLIHAAQGATRVEGWIDAGTLAEIAPEERPLSVLENPKNPSVFYNGMIAPLQRFPIKGVIWYQGESSASDPMPYEKRFASLIRSWREQWGGANFPFYWVQLASFRHTVDKSDESWAWLREAQGRVRELPQTGMAIATDLGEQNDIHPKQKREVAERLALLALKDSGKNVAAAGPRFRDVQFANAAAVVAFDHAAGGLVVKEVVMNQHPKLDPGKDPEAFRAPAERLSGFSIAGADGKFVPAEAQLNGDTVIVSSPEVPQPAAVRYAWGNFALANLFNGAGLPAEPFRTDSFPPPEVITRQAAAAGKAMDRFKTSATPSNAEDPR